MEDARAREGMASRERDHLADRRPALAFPVRDDQAAEFAIGRGSHGLHGHRFAGPAAERADWAS